MVSHSGMTAGFSSSLLVDRTTGTAAVVLWNGNGGVDDVGETLLESVAPPTD